MTSRPPVPRSGLATRLLASLTVVLLAGGVTTGLVALLVGPRVFRDHLRMAGVQEGSPDVTHIEMAYRDASLISLGLGLVIALTAALTVTWMLTRRLRRPLTELTSAARELSRGHYATRVPDVSSGTELDTLADTFNTMAARLDSIEDTRRRMLSDLAHEMRTPIAALTVYHEGLHDGVVQLGPESRAVLAEQTDRLARLAEDIDEVSTAEEGRLQLDVRRCAVADLVRTAADTVRAAYADRDVRLVVDGDGGDGNNQDNKLLVDVDRQRLGQVLTNLLGNALRHTPAGGKVSIGADRDGDEVVILVSDTGEGILPEQLPHVFERFYRGDAARTRDRTGSGIGLTISRAIVDAHGGTIEPRSGGQGQGATFTVRLPAATAD